MNRKQLMDPNAGSALMRREAGMAHSLPGETEEAAPHIFGSVWRRRWAVLSITVLFVIGAVVFLRVMPPSYTSTAQLTIDPPPQMTTFAGGVSGPMDPTAGFLWQQVTIMQSPAVCGDAAKTLLPTATEEELHDFMNVLRNRLGADVGKQDSVITLSYTDKSADSAANNVNAIVHSYVQYVTNTRQDTSHALIEVLRQEKTKYDDLLRTQQNKEIDFRKLHPELLNTTDTGTNVATAEMIKLFDAKTTAVLAESNAIAAYNTADQLRDDLAQLQQLALSQNFKTPATSDQIAQARAYLSAAQDRLMVSKGTLGPLNGQVVRDNMIVTEMTAKLQILGKKFAEEFIGSLDRAKIQAEEQVKAIQAQIDASQKDVNQVVNAQGDLKKLQNDEASTVKILDALDTQIKQQTLSVEIGRPNVRILAKAMGEDATRSPDPSRVLLLTLAMGLACGVGFALLRDKLDQRVRSAEEIAALLGLPVIGVVPHMKRGLTPLARAQAVHWDPMSEVSEAYRAVRTAVHFGVPAGQARTIVVTSPTPGDGKSTLASNLAISMAQAGKRTLLLDADFRRPVQHRMFEMKDESGLTAVLAGHEPLAKAIRRTVVEGLDLLPAGPLPLNPSELLNGESFAGILEELSQKYDHVVLDCPPVIAVTDARILGAVCDLSLLVLRAGKTTRQGAELARAGLMSVGSRLLGVVVNDVPRGEEHYGYYGSYAYQGGQGRRSLPDENGGSANGHSRSRRRLPSPSGVDSMQ